MPRRATSRNASAAPATATAEPVAAAGDFAPLARQTLRASIADRVRASILSGALAPGERIVELTIAQRLGVSRAPLREALWQLAKEGLVRFVPNKGAFVAALSETDVHHIFEVREALETRAALDVFERHDASAVEALNAACVRLEEAGRQRDMTAFTAADVAFHRTLWRLSGNPVIEEILIGVSVRFFGYGLIRDMRRSQLYEFDRVVAGHRQMVNLVAKGPRRRIIEGFEEIFSQFRDYSLHRFSTGAGGAQTQQATTR